MPSHHDVLADHVLFLGGDHRRLHNQLDGPGRRQFSHAQRHRGAGGRLSVGQSKWRARQSSPRPSARKRQSARSLYVPKRKLFAPTLTRTRFSLLAVHAAGVFTFFLRINSLRKKNRTDEIGYFLMISDSPAIYHLSIIVRERSRNNNSTDWCPPPLHTHTNVTAVSPVITRPSVNIVRRTFSSALVRRSYTKSRPGIYYPSVLVWRSRKRFSPRRSRIEKLVFPPRLRNICRFSAICIFGRRYYKADITVIVRLFYVPSSSVR